MTALVGLEQLGRGPYRASVLQKVQGAIGGKKVSGHQKIACGLGKRTDALQVPGAQSKEGAEQLTWPEGPQIRTAAPFGEFDICQRSIRQAGSRAFLRRNWSLRCCR